MQFEQLIIVFPLQVFTYVSEQIPEGERGDDSDPAKITEEIFSHEDKDKDGMISHEEFSGPKHDEL